MSLNKRYPQLQFVKQKQHFSFLLNIRGISKNNAKAEIETELRVNGNNCNQFSQMLRLLKKSIMMMKSCVMKWSLNSRLRLAEQSVI